MPLQFSILVSEKEKNQDFNLPVAIGHAVRDNVVEYLEERNACMPIRSVNITAAEAAALRELSSRFLGSDLARKAAMNAVKSGRFRLAGSIGKNEVAVLCKRCNRIDVLDRDEYFRDSHKNLWDS